MNKLTNEEIGKLVIACAHPNNGAAANLLAYTGTRTISGVIARMMQSSAEEHETLMGMIRMALAEHDRLHPQN